MHIIYYLSTFVNSLARIFQIKKTSLRDSNYIFSNKIPINTEHKMKNNTAFDQWFDDMKVHGNQNAFQQLFNTLYAPLCVFADHLLNDKDAAKDIVCDVFVQLWENRKSIELTSSIKAHLIVCTKNRCLNYIKHHSVHQKYISSIKKEELDYNNSEELYTYKELQEKLNEIILRMPKAYQIAFIMSQMHEESTNVIAKKLDVSERTVERMKKKATEIIKSQLNKYYFCVFVWSALLL